LPAVAKL